MHPGRPFLRKQQGLADSAGPLQMLSRLSSEVSIREQCSGLAGVQEAGCCGRGGAGLPNPNQPCSNRADARDGGELR